MILNCQSKALSPEEYLTVLAARIDLDSDDAVRMERVLRQGLDWPTVKKYSHQLGVQPLLYKHLSQEKYAHYVPDEVMRFLKDRHRRESIKNLRIYGQINQILDSTNQANIPVILLKGAFMAKWIYGDIGLRPMSDIDILCREEDKQIVQNRLVELGYKQETIYKSPLHEKLSAPESMHLPPFYKPNAVRIEVHLNIFPKISHNSKDMKRVWEAAIPSELNGLQVHYLSPEYQLFYLCIHLYNHIMSGGIALYWLCDIHELIRHYKDKINWKQFSSIADSLGVGAQISSILDLIRTNWNTFIPKKLLYYPDTGINKLCLKTLIRNQFTNKTRKINFLSSYSGKLKTVTEIEGWGSLFYFIWRTIFPARAYLIYKYNPGSSFMAYLYYIIRPCKLCKNALVSLFYNITFLFEKRRKLRKR